MPKNVLKSRKIKKFHFELYQRIIANGGAFKAGVGGEVNLSLEGLRTIYDWLNHLSPEGWWDICSSWHKVNVY